MFQHQEKRFVPYSPRLVYDMVADIQAYEFFLPWCQKVRIRKQDAEQVLADLIVGPKGIRVGFTSEVILDEKDLIIQTKNAGGALDHMTSHWHFIPTEEDGVAGCQINFQVEFKFKLSMFNNIFEGFFTKAILAMGQAFEDRAHDVLKVAPSNDK